MFTKIGLADGYSLPQVQFFPNLLLEVQDTPSLMDDSVVAIIQYMQYTGYDCDTIKHSYTMRRKNFSHRKKVHPVEFTGHLTGGYEQLIPLNRKLHSPWK